MKKRRMLMVVAIVLASVLSGILYGYVKSMEAPAPRQAITTVRVVAAKETIAARKRITSDMVYLKEIPLDQRTSQDFERLDEVVGRITRSEILESEPVKSGRLVDVDEMTSLSFALPEGKMAVAVAVNEVVGVAGFVKQGDKVDVLVTLPLGDGKSVTTTVLQDVEVVGVSQSMTADEDKQAQVATSVTLAVGPEEASKLVLAEETGIIRLALRSERNWGNTAASATTDDLLGREYAARAKEGAASPAAVAASSALAASPVPGVSPASAMNGGTSNRPQVEGRQVEVIRGTQVSHVSVDGGGYE